MADLDKIIEDRIGEVRTDALDLSFGEIISLYTEKELELYPDFQRLFRWSQDQRSRLIESILLELPIPQIFLLERETGVLELIDGLQRLSSIIHFVQSDLINLDPLVLDGCDVIEDLNDKTFNDLPLSLRLRLKRSSVRAIVVKRQSSSSLRYEMFKRLNTGGADLSEQEIRNCTARMLGEIGCKFYAFLCKCADDESFRLCTSTLPESLREKRGDEELVLRFFALKVARHLFKGSVRDWLDKCMEHITLQKLPFSFDDEFRDFQRLFGFLADVMGDAAFVRFRGCNPIGGLAPAYFEAITIGVWEQLNLLSSVPNEKVRDKLIETVQTEAFRDVVGSGSNSKQIISTFIPLKLDYLVKYALQPGCEEFVTTIRRHISFHMSEALL